MNIKKLLSPSTYVLAFSLLIMISGCATDDVEEIVGVCPIVLSSIPEDGDINVPLDQVISVTFNEELDPDSVNEDSFTVTGAPGLTGSITYEGMTAYFTPSSDLAPDTVYTASVTTEIEDEMGNNMLEAFTWSFTTIPAIALSMNIEDAGTLTGAGTFDEGSLVTIEAVPNEGYAFVNWTSGENEVSTSSSYQFEMDGNRNFTANFIEIILGNFAVSLSSTPSQGGTTSGSGQFSEGSTVTVTASPNAGYSFTNWTENNEVVSASSSYQFDITGNRTLVANYSEVVEDQFALILSSSPAAGGSTTGSGSFEAASEVSVTATSNTGYNFTNWTLDGAEVSTDATYTFKLDANSALIANFKLNTYTLAITSENGAVSASPEESAYNHGTEVSLTATPAEGYKFSKWSGDASGTEKTISVKMNSNKAITANFTKVQATFTLEVTVENGTVKADPEQDQYNAGAKVSLTATPADGYEFTSWSGDANGTDNPLSVTMNSNKKITANFTEVQATFTLEVIAENGTVKADPEQEQYNSGAKVNLTATPANGYEFTSWSGDANGSDNPLSVTMNSNKKITANFTAITDSYSLNITSVNGTVKADPEQVSYEDGTQVRLTATPDNGYEFSNWSGDATGNEMQLDITMNSDKNITANFTQVQAAGPQGIDLGSAGDFVVLSGAGITNTGVTTRLIGDVGSYPTATIAGLDETNVQGTLYTVADPIVEKAKLDLTKAYNDGNSRATNAISLPGQLGGLTLAPGLYVNSSTTGISGTGPQGILTLHGDANAVWIFKTGSTLITDPATSIVLTGGAKAENIFWIVGSSATLGTTSVFYGNILADISITLNTGAVLNGRALTRTASVTLDSNKATKP